MSLFPKNVLDFGFFTIEMECERGKQDFTFYLLMQQVSLYFKTKMPGKRIAKNIVQLICLLLQMQICQGNHRYVLPENQDD